MRRSHKRSPVIGKDLVDRLKKKLTKASGASKTITDQRLRYMLGLSTVQNLKNSGGVSAAQVATIVDKAMRTAQRTAATQGIRPIVEFFELTATDSKGGTRQELFDGAHHPYETGLKAQLQKLHGIYIFYDSRGRALYIGKARKLTLWNEMNNAFNRDRGIQTVWRVGHPENRIAFKPYAEKTRRIFRERVLLYELAHYMTAYDVDDGLVDTLEALLVRSFANDLLNARMENFAVARKKSTGKAKRRRRDS